MQHALLGLVVLIAVLAAANVAIGYVAIWWPGVTGWFWVLLAGGLVWVGLAAWRRAQKAAEPVDEAAVADEEAARRIAMQLRPTSETIEIPHFAAIDGDDEDLEVDNGGDDASAGITFGIRYGGPGGKATQRVIRVISVRRDADGEIATITAFCQLRNAVRMFRAESILAAYDYRTGRTLDDWTRIFDHDVAGAAGDHPAHGDVMRVARPGLKVLVWLAKTDAQVTQAERRVIFDYVRVCMLDQGGEVTSFDARKVSDWMESYRPTTRDAVTALLSLAAAPARFNALKEYCVALVKADGPVDAQTRQNLEHLMKVCQLALAEPKQKLAA